MIEMVCFHMFYKLKVDLVFIFRKKEIRKGKVSNNEIN